jgi:ornithine cyclodeaminase/alanine dehydrogenase-like protein (mu-crystallin family)
VALILREQEVIQILTMKEGVRLVEESFRLYGQGRASVAPRLAMKLEGEAGAFRVMAASAPELGGFGLKTLTGIPGKRKSGSTYFAMLVFDAASGALAAVLPATYLTGIRTGAASAVATKHMARAGASRVALLGAGVQGRSQIAGLREVRPVSQVTVFDIDAARAAALVRSLEEEGLAATAAPSPREAVSGQDIVVSATTSAEPVILGEWLEEGMHVNAVGANSPTKRELNARAFQRALVVLDYKEQVLQEAGDLMEAIRSGAVGEGQIYAELCEIVTGGKPGRQTDRDITLFKSVGVAFEDVAVATWVCQEARARGLGTEIDLELPPAAG